ncbi:flagellar biosynthetic protein FliR [Tropicibacter oceani]|uniref:Flagellar biosynthetic protein FliR n=2 Tax=Tropicibacter oceani TaxID=3058420 RepID=A0ABY8QPL4_9RHOB|nr:flagellar biosynthetic protein FliR [Tropicibacter oceani]WGW05772.1 flagellar biosynthetic protein FliR [Tropicibacter oceani]
MVFFRVGAAMAVLPALGEQMLSSRVKLVLALVLTSVVAPAVLPNMDLPTMGMGGFVSALVTESLSGLFMGIMLRLFILAIQMAGSIAAQATSLAQIFGGQGLDPLPAVGHILTISALALLMATGFHVKAAAYLVLSYDILPPFAFPDPSAVADAGRAQVGKSVALGFSLAAPFVILSVLYNLTLGVINKAMPQLMVAFVGAPVITLGSIGMLLLCAPIILSVWLEALEGFLANPFR